MSTVCQLIEESELFVWQTRKCKTQKVKSSWSWKEKIRSINRSAYSSDKGCFQALSSDWKFTLVRRTNSSWVCLTVSCGVVEISKGLTFSSLSLFVCLLCLDMSIWQVHCLCNQWWKSQKWNSLANFSVHKFIRWLEKGNELIIIYPFYT